MLFMFHVQIVLDKQSLNVHINMESSNELHTDLNFKSEYYKKGGDSIFMKMQFYDVKTRSKVDAEVTDKTTYQVKGQTKYAVKGKTSDGRNLTRFVSKDAFDSVSL